MVCGPREERGSTAMELWSYGAMELWRLERACALGRRLCDCNGGGGGPYFVLVTQLGWDVGVSEKKGKKVQMEEKDRLFHSHGGSRSF